MSRSALAVCLSVTALALVDFRRSWWFLPIASLGVATWYAWTLPTLFGAPLTRPAIRGRSRAVAVASS